MTQNRNWQRRRKPKRGCLPTLLLVTTLVALVAATACEPKLPPPAPTVDAKVSIVYDSITWAATSELEAAHPEWDLYGYMGFQMKDVAPHVNGLRDAGALREVAFALMVNDSRPLSTCIRCVGADGWSTADENLWTSVVFNLHPDTHVVIVKPWLTVADPAWYPEIDKARAYADLVGSLRPNTTIVDWQPYAVAEGVLAYDGMHLQYNQDVGMHDATAEAAAARIAVLEEGLL